MANTLKFKRGLLAGLPTGAEGEPLFTTDTADLYIGTSTGNQRFQKYIASGTTSQYLRGDGSLATFPTNIITGTGTLNYIPRFLSSSTLGNSVIVQNGTFIGIGTASADYALTVGGSINVGQPGVSLGILLVDILSSIPSSSVKATIGVTNSGFGYSAGALLLQPRTGVAASMIFATEGTAKMTLTSAGRLLLGTTVEGTQTLQVAGNVKFDTDAATNGFYWNNTTKSLGVGTSAPNAYVDGANAQQSIAIVANGRVGLNFQDTSGTNRYLNIGVNGANAFIEAIYSTCPTINYKADSQHKFFTQGTEKLTITSAGSVGIGSTALSVYNLRISKTITGANPFAVWQDGTVMSTASGTIRGFSNSLRTEAATFTVSNYAHFGAEQFALGAGSAITTQVGFLVDSTLTGATNNYAFQGSLAAGTGRWNLFMNGSARNFLGGRLLLATTSDLGTIVTNLAITGSATTAGINQLGTVQTDVSTLAVGIWNQMNLATGGTFTSYMHYRADVGTLGGSTLTNQYGYFVSGNAIGATNNYGFFGDIAAGTGRWNLYMNGTGANYLNGNTGYSTTNPLTKVHIRTGNAASTLEGLRLANGSNDPGAGNRLSFYFSDGASNIAGGFLDVVKNGSDGDMLFFTSVSNGSPTEKVRFFGGGNVGIGTGSTNSGDRLQVSGTLRVTSQSTLLGNIVVGTQSLGTGMYWDNTNNRLGIGHSIPATQLHVRNAAGSIITIESTNAGSVATPVETSINFNGFGANLQAQISSQDRQANQAGGWLYFRIKNSSNVLQDRLIIDRDGIATFGSNVISTQYRLSALNTAPATSSSTGTLGEIRIDADHIYICTATNTWKRVAIATF